MHCPWSLPLQGLARLSAKAWHQGRGATVHSLCTLHSPLLLPVILLWCILLSVRGPCGLPLRGCCRVLVVKVDFLHHFLVRIVEHQFHIIAWPQNEHEGPAASSLACTAQGGRRRLERSHHFGCTRHHDRDFLAERIILLPI